MTVPTPYFNDNKNSFAYATCNTRWPIIINDCIRDIKAVLNKSNETHGNEIIAQLEGLVKDITNDAIVRLFTVEEIELDSDLERFNKGLQEFNDSKQVTWKTGPWLFLECYIYRIIHLFFIATKDPFWTKFDVFESLKNQTFKQSEFGVLELCKRYENLSEQLSSADDQLLQLLFNEFIDISLWGNATDLSLLAGNVTLEDIKSVQGAEVRKKNEEKILVNDLHQAWNVLHKDTPSSKRVDVVLDNSGFELFTDLVLALFLLDAKIIGEFHIHVKNIPWFVSDTMAKDFDLLMSQLVDPEFYVKSHKNAEDEKAITFLHSKLEKYYKSGAIVVDEFKFWTLESDYWTLPQDKEVYEHLQKSNLVIFKGDLNYRKLTGDRMWDPTTPFKTSIQQLASLGLPILSLRTCKADVVVGLPEGVFEKISQEYKDMGNEVGEFWSSSGKWAVISFNQS